MSDNEQKDENRKTVDDILAEMERESIIHVCIPAIDLERYVKRIKEAWKRERAKVEADALSVGGIVEAARTAEKSSAVGNAAAICKALDRIGNVAVFVAENCGDQQTATYMADIISFVQSAISAPARNCDLYDDAEIAWRAWLEDAENWDEFGSPGLELCEWLFATAKKKGENDGR